MKKLLGILISLQLLLIGPTFAHDEKYHKPPQLKGLLVSIADDNILIETGKGESAVEISDQTKFEIGSDGASASRADLRTGQLLAIRGHKLASGKFAASSIMLEEVGGGENIPQEEPNH